MRNRVSHNEPLCFDNRQFDMTYVKQMYVLISDFFTWINPNIIPTHFLKNILGAHRKLYV